MKIYIELIVEIKDHKVTKIDDFTIDLSQFSTEQAGMLLADSVRQDLQKRFSEVIPLFSSNKKDAFEMNLGDSSRIAYQIKIPSKNEKKRDEITAAFFDYIKR